MIPLASVNEDLQNDCVSMEDIVHLDRNATDFEVAVLQAAEDLHVGDSLETDAVSARLTSPTPTISQSVAVSHSSSKGSLASESVASKSLASESVASTMKAPGDLKKARLSDFILPLVPFCCKCSPLKPTDCLCLKPETLGGKTDASRSRTEQANTDSAAPSGAHLTSLPRRISIDKRISGNAQDIRMRASLGTNKWAKALESLTFPNAPLRSRFIGCGTGGDDRDNFLCKDEKMPPVLRRLTPFEIALLECWTIQHVKSLYSEIHARANLDAPMSGNRYQENMHSATICQLVRKANKNELDEVEHAFMIARLEKLPLFCDLPEGLIQTVAPKIEAHTFNKGTVIFERGTKVDGMYILVQGDVEFSEDALDTLEDGSGVKAAPAVLCLEDVCTPNKERLFLLKPASQRIRSRTAWISDSDDAESMATILWVPLSVIVKAANIFRRREAKDRIDLINELFAPAMRLDRRLCEKYCHLFDLEIFAKSYAILQQGSCPSMDTARIFMVVEGEVHLVRLEKSKGIPNKAIKDTVGCGKLLGENALYAEPSPHYAMCHTDPVKVLSIRVWDFFEKLLQRSPSTPLDKPLICAGTWENRAGANDAGPEVVEFLSKAKLKEKTRKCKELAIQTSRDFRISNDNSVVKATEWKTVKSKCMLNWRLPPSTRPNKAVSGNDIEEPYFFQEPDLNYPRDSDLYPSAQRSIIAAPSTSRALSSTAFALCGAESRLSSLDGKIKRKIAESAELEVEHYLHSSLGMCVESADGRPQSEARGGVTRNSGIGRSSPTVKRPQTRAGGESYSARPSRSTVLWTCGAALKIPHLEKSRELAFAWDV